MAAETSHRAFLVFEGGGAKGIAHLGALKAIEEADIEILGASGTSAGAMVAALVAAGYRSDELVCHDNSETILDRLGIERGQDTLGKMRASSLFGAWGWRRVRLARALNAIGFGRVLVTATAVIAALVYLGAYHWVGPLESPDATGQFAAAIICSVAIVIALLLRTIFAGLAKTHRVANAMNAVLAKKVTPGPDGLVRFENLTMPLKIVATELADSTLTIFSRECTPKDVVADAVAASIAIPVIFDAASVGGKLYYDGGLVSNMPAWGWDEERAIDPGALTLAIGLDEQDEPPRPRSETETALGRGGARLYRAVIGPFQNIFTGAKAAVFGAGVLNLRGADGLITLSSSPKLKLLQFDLTSDDRAAAIENSYTLTKARLLRRLEEEPQLYRNICRDVVTGASRWLGPVKTRAYLAMREPAPPGEGTTVWGLSQRLLRYRHGFNNEQDADRNMSVPIQGSHAGLAIDTGQASFSITPLPDHIDLPGAANRERRDAIWKGMTWQIAIPIFHPEYGAAMPLMVFMMDGDGDPAYAEAAFIDIGLMVESNFDAVLPQLKE